MSDTAGRPSKYTDAILEEIEEKIAQGIPLAEICRADHMPTDRTVRYWAKTDDRILSAIACAREFGYDAISERLRATARGKTEESGGDSSGDVQRDKLIIDTDLKLLAKWDPKRFGDKQQVEHSGNIGIGSALDALPDN